MHSGSLTLLNFFQGIFRDTQFFPFVWGCLYSVSFAKVLQSTSLKFHIYLCFFRQLFCNIPSEPWTHSLSRAIYLFIWELWSCHVSLTSSRCSMGLNTAVPIAQLVWIICQERKNAQWLSSDLYSFSKTSTTLRLHTKSSLRKNVCQNYTSPRHAEIVSGWRIVVSFLSLLYLFSPALVRITLH